MKELKSKSLLIYDPETGEKKEIDIFRGESAYEAAVRLGMTTLSEEQWLKEYEANRDEAIAAIKVKAAETLESIPDDYTQLSEEVGDISEEIGYCPISNLLYGFLSAESQKMVTTAIGEYDPTFGTGFKGVPLSAGHKYLVYYSILVGENASGWPAATSFVAYLRNIATNTNITSVTVGKAPQMKEWSVGDRFTFYGYFTPTTDYARVGGWYITTNGGTNEKYAHWINDKMYLLDVTGLSDDELAIVLARLDAANGNKNGVPVETRLDIAERRITDLEQGYPVTADLLFWGDSLTAGAGGGGTSYPAVCAQELGLTYKNCGVGGETGNTIAARQGGNSVIIPAGAVNGTYETLTDIFGANIKPLLQGNGSGSGNKLIVNGVECTLSYASATGYTISGYTGKALTVPAIARFAGSDFNGKVVCIWAGNNGVNVGGDTSADAVIAIIDSMIAHLGHSNYVVFTRWITNATDSTFAAEDPKMLKRYGNKLFPVRRLLVDYGLDLAGIAPTAQDETDIAKGTVPTSLRSDGIHLNAAGYTAVGKMLANKIRSLGYV